MRGSRGAEGMVGQKCPEWDSNPHLMVFETISSAIGISGLMSR